MDFKKDSDLANITLRRKIYKKINEQVDYCYVCQPGWDDEYWDSYHVDLYDLVSELGFDREKLEKAIVGIECPNCGSGFDSIFNEVVLKDDWQLKVDKIFEKFRNIKLVADLSNFNEHLTNYPYLGMVHPVGKRLLKGLEKFKDIKVSDEFWYRARLLNEESRLFKGKEMWAPNPLKHKVPEGRYNHTGQSYLYLSNNELTAFHEVKHKNEQICGMQKYKLEKIDNVLDLRDDYFNMDVDADIYALAIIYKGGLTQIVPKNVYWKPQYLISRFIADAAKFLGFKGIKFSSVFNTGDNLILFKPSHKNVLFEGEAYLYNNGAIKNAI